MGIIRSGPPEELVLRLKDCFRIQAFVETGTYYGDTAMWAAVHFPQVITIEYSRSIYEKAIARHGQTPNVNFVFGDSRTILQTILPMLRGPAVIWLDGHWSGSETYGDGDECPLLEEIQAVVASQQAHFILIDDARLFASPPPRPHRPEQWPSIVQVIDSLKSGNYAPYIVIVEDVIVAIPEHARELLVRYCQEVNTRTWEQRPQTFPISGSPTASSEPDRSLPTIQTHRKRTPIAGGELLDRLRYHGLWQTGQPLRLHLGCGEKYLDGYVNVDYPQSEHNVMLVRADLFADLMELDFPAESVDEIRLHHVFEHFSRVAALALLIRWHRWLKGGGRIHIETPDLIGSAKMLLSDAPFSRKMASVRHLAGDQAASWAYHIDYWFPERFVHTLSRLGFDRIDTRSTSWPHPPYLCNVEAVAYKPRSASLDEQLAAADSLLWDSTVSSDEKPTWETWRGQLRAVLTGQAVSSLPNNTRFPPSESILGAQSALSVQAATLPLDEIHDFNQRSRDRWISAKAQTMPAGASVLDVGAGTCPYRQLFTHCDYKTHDFKKYEGVKLGGEAKYGEIDYVSDILHIPLPDNSLDMVLCTEVIEHVPEPIEALRELIRLLKPGGRLLITAPLGSGLHQLPFHYYGGFTPEWYKHFARKCGSQVIEVTPNGGFFRLLAQESARLTWTLPQHQHLHGSNAEFIRQLFGEWIPRYLFALEEQCFIDQFTVGYHVELQKQTDPIVSKDGVMAPENEERQLRGKLLMDFRDVSALVGLADIERQRGNEMRASMYLIAALALAPNHVEANLLLQALEAKVLDAGRPILKEKGMITT